MRFQLLGRDMGSTTGITREGRWPDGHCACAGEGVPDFVKLAVILVVDRNPELFAELTVRHHYPAPPGPQRDGDWFILIDVSFALK